MFISEDIDDNDCIELKDYFKRGQSYGKTGSDLKTEIFNNCIKAGFSKIELESFEEVEYYPSIEALEYLLGYTPILNGYDPESDRETLEKYCSDNSSRKGIKLNRRLFAFYLVK